MLKFTIMAGKNFVAVCDICESDFIGADYSESAQKLKEHRSTHKKVLQIEKQAEELFSLIETAKRNGEQVDLVALRIAQNVLRHAGIKDHKVSKLIPMMTLGKKE